jgi:hypothetical protein
MHSVCVVKLHITVNYTKVLSVPQQCFYGKINATTTVKHKQVFMYSAQYYTETKEWPSSDVQG